MCTEDASRLPKFPTCCHPPHTAILCPVHSTGPHPPPPSSLSDPLPSRARHHFLRHAPPPFGHTDASLATRVSLFHPPTLHTATLAPWAHLGVPAARSSVYPRHRRFRRSPRASISAQRYIIDLRSPPPNSYHVQYVAVVCWDIKVLMSIFVLVKGMVCIWCLSVKYE
jgi:hypothetical protein